jgi:hemerythrin-like domain-containing protein
MTTTNGAPVLLPGQHASPAGPVDLMNMYVMHHAFRRDLADFRSAVDRSPVSDHDRWTALRRRWQHFATALHSHHSAEDAGLWPLLLERVSGRGDDDARTVLEAMQAEHARIDPLLEECLEGFTRLAEDPTDAVRRALSRSLAATGDLLDGHLGHEERDAMALVQRYLVQADWVRVEKEHFRPAYSPKEVWFVVPWALFGLPADIRRKNLDEAGLPMKIVWRLSRRSFARQQAAAFGGTPRRA